MPSYLATIRYEADNWASAEVKVLDALVATGGDRFIIRPGYEMPGDDQGYRCSFKTLKGHSAGVVSCGASAKYRDLPGDEPSTLCDEHYERVMRVSARFGQPAGAPPPESVAAARALSPAVVEELRQMWRADARDEAKSAIRDFVLDSAHVLGRRT